MVVPVPLRSVFDHRIKYREHLARHTLERAAQQKPLLAKAHLRLLKRLQVLLDLLPLDFCPRAPNRRWSSSANSSARKELRRDVHR